MSEEKDLRKISENLEKMIKKFNGLREQNNENISKKMFFKSKVVEAEEKISKSIEKLESLGLDMKKDTEAQLVEEYEELEVRYLGVVKAVTSNKNKIEEVEIKLQAFSE